MQQFFDLTICEVKSMCGKENTLSCNNCIRNKKPLVDNFQSKTNNSFLNNNVCDRCPNSPTNGGTGNCNCTLNLPQITS